MIIHSCHYSRFLSGRSGLNKSLPAACRLWNKSILSKRMERKAGQNKVRLSFPQYLIVQVNALVL